jgi:hypothetical protein
MIVTARVVCLGPGSSIWINMPLRPALLLGVLAIALGLPQVARAESGRLSLVELYTSQGCSSCPPADALLKTYASRADVIALTLPVDYWDYLGWKDTLASPKHTQRQRAYAAKRGDGEVYTPQIVVNGLVHVVGSHPSDIDRAIDQSSRKLEDQRVSIRAIASDRVLAIDLGAAPTGSKHDMATVWLAVVEPQVDVEIKFGENRGKRLSYFNVVRDLSPVAAWTGTSTHIEIPESALLKPGERCAVILQAGEVGRILGATWVQVK